MSLRAYGLITIFMFVTAIVHIAEATPTDDMKVLKERIEKLEKENKDLKTDVQDIREQSNSTYLETRRGEAVREMVEAVLEDAEARQSLAAEGSTAGWDDNFYLRSSDGKFNMVLSGFIQARWVANFRNNPGPLNYDGDDLYGPGTQSMESGFQLARARFRLHGTVQLAVDRSYNTFLFSTLHATGIYASYKFKDVVKVQAHIADNGNTDFASATTLFDSFTEANATDGNVYEFAMRIDIKLMGEWAQYEDFSSWSGEEAALFIGGGISYVFGSSTYINGADLDSDWNILSWAFDIRFEWNGFAIAAGIQGAHASSNGGPNNGSNLLDFDSETFDQYAGVVQISYNINDTIEPFLRVSGFIADSEGTSLAVDNENGSLNLTIGLNWFIHKHNLKFTFDVTYAIEEIETEASYLGFLSDGDSESGQLIIRLQVQLKY